MRVPILLCAFLISTAALADTYIVPMYGITSGSWYPQIAVFNPHDQPVTLWIVRAYPMVTDRCVICLGHPEITIDAKARTVLYPFWSDEGQYVVAGAYELETSLPLRIETMYFGWAADEVRQRLDVAREWLPAGEHFAVAQSGFDVRQNAVVINPNDFEIEVSVWMAPRDENEVRITLPARATRMVTLRERRCGGEACLPHPDYPPPPDTVQFESPARFLGGVSSIGPSWALFNLAE